MGMMTGTRILDNWLRAGPAPEVNAAGPVKEERNAPKEWAKHKVSLRAAILPKPAILVRFLLLLFSLAVACTPGEVQFIEGVLENVDTANGEITIVTKDDKTITLSIPTDDAENLEGPTTSVSALHAGVSLQIEATEHDGGQVPRRLKKRQAEVEGTLVGIDG